MFKKVSVLIPYKRDNGQRDVLFEFVKKFYKKQFPKAELCIGEDRSELFSRSQAINAAAKQASRDIFVIADGDILYNPELLTQSIKLLDQYAWVIPYNQVINLSEKATQDLLRDGFKWPIVGEGEARNWLPVGGINVVPRKHFEKVNGFDERFIGWGRDDDAFAIAMNALCGSYGRIPSPIYHLWHPRVGPARNPNMVNNDKLFKRYNKLKNNSEGMMKLVNEKDHHVV